MATKKATQAESATVADPTNFPDGPMFPGLLEAAESVDAFKRMLDGVLQLSAAAKDITTWDNTRRELEARVSQLRDMAQVAIDARIKAEADAEDLKATCADNVIKTENQMKALRDEARADAAEIARRAKEAAADYAAEKKAMVDARVSKAAEELAKVKAEVEAQREVLSGMVDQVESRARERDELVAAIDAIKAKLGVPA